jgi:excisionase family DNA binding protein
MGLSAPMTDTTLLTPAEAARLLRVSTKTVARWAKDGRIEFVRLPSGHIRIPTEAVTRIATPEAVES